MSGTQLVIHPRDNDPGVYCTIHNDDAAAPNSPHRPTETTYQALQAAYDHFNRELFEGLLLCCLITLQRRGRRTHGYYSPERFGEIDGTDRTDEIALNPQHFLHQPMRQTLSTLVHEMVHLWQQHHGKPGRGAYHNQEWAAKMKAIGLHPSDTGAPGGKEVGQQMSHYIIEDGPFAVAFKALASDGFRLAWGELTGRLDGDEDNGGDQGNDKDRSNRIKYTCPVCDVNVWGKPQLRVICGKCEVVFQAGNLHEVAA